MPISLFLELDIYFLERARVDIKSFFSSTYLDDASKMTCVSRIDDIGKNLFKQENLRKGRWNLYSQIAIEHDTLKCTNETYALPSLCYAHKTTQPCTLLDTNEVVDIGYEQEGFK